MSELIDAAISLVRRDFVRYLVIVAVGIAPWQVARLVAVRATGADFSGDTVPDIGALVAVAGVAVLFFSLIEASVAVALARAYEGDAVDAGLALRTGLRRWLPVLAATVLKYALLTLVVLAGVLLGGVIVAILVFATGGRERDPGDPLVIGLVVGTMLLGAVAALPLIGRYAAVPMTAALEPLGPIAALRRSAELTRGLWKHAVAVSALAWIIVALPGFFAGSLLALLPGSQIVQQALGVVLTLLLTPVYVATLVALYFDLRIRKEGFDLELMASRLAPAEPDAGPDAPATGGA